MSNVVSIARKSQYLAPEDLAKMRAVFRESCRNNPQVGNCEVQRLSLARAIVVTYRKNLSEEALIAVALHMVRLKGTIGHGHSDVGKTAVG